MDYVDPENPIGVPKSRHDGRLLGKGSKMSEAGSSGQNEDFAYVDSPSRATRAGSRTGQVRKPRKPTQWPKDKMFVVDADEEGKPLDLEVSTRLSIIWGLCSRQKVPILLGSIDELSDDQREFIFKEVVQKYVEYPEHLKQIGYKYCIHKIGQLARRFKCDLVKYYVREDKEPFEEYPHLNREDWDMFVVFKESEEFQKVSEEKKKLRARNELNHHLGPSGYEGKKAQWEAEDARYLAEGRVNPWKQYPGRAEAYLRARGYVNESGEIVFQSPKVQQVAERILYLANDASFVGCREDDHLSQGLQNKEHRGRVRAVSSSKGWKHGFPDDRDMWKKKRRKTITKEDEEAIAQRAAQSVLGSLRPWLDTLGIELPLELPVQSCTPHAAGYNSSSSVGNQNVNSPLTPASQSAPILSPDTLDRLKNPPKCKLLYNASGRVMEVAKGRVFPELHVLRDCPIHQGYAVVVLDHVYDDSAHFTLEFSPDEQTVTLGDARYGRVQWRRAHIVVADASTPDSSPSPHSQHVAASSDPQPLLESTPRVEASPQPPPLSKPTPASSQPELSKPPQDAVASCQPPRSKSAANVANLSLRPPRQPAQRGKKSSPKKKACPPNKIADTWIKDNPKYKSGKPLLTAEELRNAGKACIELHNYYLQRLRDKKTHSIVLKYNEQHFLSSTSYFVVSFSDMYDLFNLDALDVSLLRCFTLHLMKEMKGRPCAFVDPAPMTIDNLHDSRKEVVQLLVRAIRTYKDKEYIMFPHNTGGNWVLVVISVKKKKCCQQPSGSKLCGFYVAQHMLIIAEACISDKSIDDIAFPESPFEDAMLHNIRDRIASFLVSECINRKGEFFCNSNE
ncbi:hypothetical protein EJB05_36162, partial [Eragrostis curvula]